MAVTIEEYRWYAVILADGEVRAVIRHTLDGLVVLTEEEHKEWEEKGW